MLLHVPLLLRANPISNPRQPWIRLVPDPARQQVSIGVNTSIQSGKEPDLSTRSMNGRAVGGSTTVLKPAGTLKDLSSGINHLEKALSCAFETLSTWGPASIGTCLQYLVYAVAA